jgi:ParB/RepB/Spo0J family partition protein
MGYAQNLSAFGVPGPQGFKAIDVRDIGIHNIDVGPRQRPLDRKKVEELAKSIMEHGQKQPIAVRYKKNAIGGVELIFGYHRLEAMKLIDREGLDKRCSIWASIYPEDYPDIRIQLDEIIENLHRNDLTPSEKAVHQEKYASILKQLKKVSTAYERKVEAAKGNKNASKDTAKNGNPHVGLSVSLTTKTALIKELGTPSTTVERRHQHAVTLAKREGYTGETSLEKMTADEHSTVAELAGKAATKKKEKAEATGKAERHTDALRQRKPTIAHIELDVLELPNEFVQWCRRRLEDQEKPLTLDILKATHQALGDLIQEISTK